MAPLTWSNHYLIGNDTIDAEHQEMFRLSNALQSCWTGPYDRTKAAKTLRTLIDYAKLHFVHEEQAMAAAHYPNLAQHHKTHDTQLSFIEQLQLAIQDGSASLDTEALRQINTWLLAHILESDSTFRDFLSRKKGSERSPHSGQAIPS